MSTRWKQGEGEDEDTNESAPKLSWRLSEGPPEMEAER